MDGVLLIVISAVTDLYQSNGACFDTCKATYAFAVVQYKQCWCSDYIPADTTDVGSCDEDCPGFPSDKCGSLAKGLFGYIALSKEPSGTLGAARSSSSSSEQLVSSQSPGRPFPSSSFTDLVPSYVTTAAESSLSLAPFLGSLDLLPISASRAYLSSETPFLTSFVQSSVSNPDLVTVQRTVTASPSVKISIISLVCIDSFLPEILLLPCRCFQVDEESTH